MWGRLPQSWEVARPPQFHKHWDWNESGSILVLTFARAVPQARYKVLGHKLGARHCQVVPLRAMQSQWPIISWKKLQQRKKDVKSCILLQASEALEGLITASTYCWVTLRSLWFNMSALGPIWNIFIKFIGDVMLLAEDHTARNNAWDCTSARHSRWVSEPTSANFCSSFWCDPFSPGHRLHFSH